MRNCFQPTIRGTERAEKRFARECSGRAHPPTKLIKGAKLGEAGAGVALFLFEHARKVPWKAGSVRLIAEDGQAPFTPTLSDNEVE